MADKKIQLKPNDNKNVVYKIECVANGDSFGKIYIGKTTQKFKNRKQQHINTLKNNNHSNSYLQRIYNKYGKDCFVFEIIGVYPIEELGYWENFHWNQISKDLRIGSEPTLDGGYLHDEKWKSEASKRFSGSNNPQYGKSPSKETRELLSKRHSGKNNFWYGKHLSEGHKAKLKKPKSETTKQKLKENHANYSGENHPQAKFNREQVIEIRRLYEEKNIKIYEIVKIYNSKWSTIWGIVNYKTWKIKNKETGNESLRKIHCTQQRRR